MSDRSTPPLPGAEAGSHLDDEPADFVRSFFRKGFDLAEELIRDNDALRKEVESLQAENGRLRRQVTADDKVGELMKTVEGLEDERRELMRRSSELDELRQDYERRQATIEREMNELANLYVASHHLHTTLNLAHVVQHIRDMVFQLVGAESFAILVRDPQTAQKVAVAKNELAEAELSAILEGTSAIEDTFLTGIPTMRDGSLSRGSVDEPLALVPMMANGEVIGLIVILSLLEQKTEWEDVDRALLGMLGTQAGTALIAANLYASADETTSGLAGLGERL